MVQILKDVDAEMKASSAPEDEALVAVGFDPIFFPDEKRLDKTVLDQVSTTRPILVRHASGHVASVKSAMLKQSGITRETKNEGVPMGEDGEPVGELQEMGQLLAKSAIAKILKLSSGTKALVDQSIFCRNAGVTTCTELLGLFVIKPQDAPAWKEAVEDPKFPARIVVYNAPGFPGTGTIDYAGAAHKIKELRAKYDGPKFRMPGAKLLVDGSLQGFTAVLREPGYYKPPSGNPKHQGIAKYKSTQEFIDALRPLHEAGIQTHTHCNVGWFFVG